MMENVIYEQNVIYAGEVIYDVGSNRAYPGPRGAQRHREIRGPARKSPRSGSISLLEELDPGSARRLRHHLSGTRGCAPSPMTSNVIYAGDVMYDAGSNLAYPG